MKKLLLAITLAMLLPQAMVAQPSQNAARQGGKASSMTTADMTTYDILVFQNKNIGDDITRKYSAQLEGLRGNASRGFLMSLFGTMKATSKQTASTNITSLINSGVSYVSNLVRSKKKDWRQLVERENRFEKTLQMLENLDDFYSKISFSGALDPSSLSFNGIGCLQKRGNDTVLYLVCHLDTTEYGIKRILRHSKFELTLDTLAFNPSLCDLPNDSAHAFSQRQHFSFQNSRDLALRFDMDITSSWINQAIQVYNDTPLGHFSINVPVNETSLDADGMFRYHRGGHNKTECDIVGESFIVPRSYIGVRDSNGDFHDAWGTGQYKVTLKISESCGISPELEQNWKTDWKRRKAANRTHITIMRRIRQYWDANGSKWITNLLEIPAAGMTQGILSTLQLNTSGQASAKSAMQGMSAQGSQGAIGNQSAQATKNTQATQGSQGVQATQGGANPGAQGGTPPNMK